MTELASSGGWCAPSSIFEITGEMLAVWAEQHPAGGPCSTCEGSGEILSRPLCPCSMCVADVEMLECWHCDGTGVEPEYDLEPEPVSLLEPVIVDLPSVAVSRGGIRWADA